VTGALLRKRRLERFGERETAIAMEAFASGWRGSREQARRVAVVGASEALIERAVELAALACFDRGLREAAAGRGHALLPVSLPLSP